MGDIPDITMRDNLDDCYAKKSMERRRRHEAATCLLHQAITPGHVSHMRGDVGQAILGKASPLAKFGEELEHSMTTIFTFIYQ